MQPTDDGTLSRQYSENRSDDAFAALVTRHINLVYSVALRQVGDPHQAEEITQAVFILLAKKAAQLRHDKALSSWLFQATRLTASNFVRGETRRHHREQEAHMQSVLNESGGDIWPRIAPLLDDAVAGLSEEDRHAIVLRFYEGRNLREVGAALGASEDAAEKRVNRAVEKLRTFFAKRGVTISASGLVVVISANAVQAAPVGLAVAISAAAAHAGTTLATAATAAATKAITMTTLQKTLITVAVVGSVTTSLLLQQYRRTKASEADQLAQQQSRQLAQLKTDNDRLSGLVALAGSPSANNPDELHRLREETAALRQKTNGLAAIEKDRQELNRTMAKARQDSQDTNVQNSAWSENAKAKAKYSGQLFQALMDYATQHQNQFPTNFDEVAAVMSAQTGKNTDSTPDQFEIVYHGSLTALEKYANPGLIFLIREKQPWKNSDGKWAKIYATVTGVEIISVADGDFDTFEKKHILPSESSKP